MYMDMLVTPVEAHVQRRVLDLYERVQKFVLGTSYMYINLRLRTQVHVRTDVDTLVIPVEVHVIKGGIHRLPELLDFETLTSAKARKEVHKSPQWATTVTTRLGRTCNVLEHSCIEFRGRRHTTAARNARLRDPHRKGVHGGLNPEKL